MDNIKFYQVSPDYIDYLIPHAPHLFHNKQIGQQNDRKYIGIVLQINAMNYFAPLTSFKEKHKRMKNGLDFLKVKHYAVINLNSMSPVPACYYTHVDISKESNSKYKNLLLSEYRYINQYRIKSKKYCYIISFKNKSRTFFSYKTV